MRDANATQDGKRGEQNVMPAIYYARTRLELSASVSDQSLNLFGIRTYTLLPPVQVQSQARPRHDSTQLHGGWKSARHGHPAFARRDCRQRDHEARDDEKLDEKLLGIAHLLVVYQNQTHECEYHVQANQKETSDPQVLGSTHDREQGESGIKCHELKPPMTWHYLTWQRVLA